MLYSCVLLYVALIYIRPAEIVPGWEAIPFVDILTGISAFVAIFSLASKPRPFANLPHDKLILIFWVLIAVSSVKVWFWAVYDSVLAFSPVVVCYFLIRAAVTTQRQLTGLIYLLIGLNVFLAINGIVQFHTGVGLGNIQTRMDRIYGTGIFNDPNDLGMTFVMAVPLLVFVLSRAGNWAILRVLAFVGLVLVLAGIYYTNSRGSLVGLAAALVAMSFLRFRNIAGTVVAVALLSVIVVAAPSRGAEMDSSESSAQSRIQSWAEGWSMFKTHPLTGVGFGQYTEYHVKVAHNSFVETFAELGILGALCLVGMFYWYFKGVRLIPEKNVGSPPWRRALLASAVGVLTCAWFLSRQYVPIFYVLLAMGACAATVGVPAESKDELRGDGKDVVAVVALTILGLVVVNLSIRALAIWAG
jgi:putative inorganic carbon (HCO3(-)) transporter